MPRDLDFLPDGGRAIALDVEMRHRLKDSLSTIEREASQLRLTPKLDLSRPIEAISQGIQNPAMWAFYGDLCSGIALDDAEGFYRAAQALAEAALKAPPKGVRNLTDNDLGQGYADLFARTIDDNPDLPLNLIAVEASEFQRAKTLIAQARDLVAQSCPNLLVEIDTFAKQIVLATGRPGGTIFSGAATVFLWGAILLNPLAIDDPFSMAEALAHETAHVLLYGLTGGADVTTNEPDERYPSPLRDDLRPVEGIAHATFVLARMVYALECLAHLESLNSDERQKLAAMLETNIKLFDTAAETTRRYARFTKEGSEIFESCFKWMDARA
ncbi:MAG: HEXXH motif-containing putative peptide modification protein [Methylovirgula sp.]